MTRKTPAPLSVWRTLNHDAFLLGAEGAIRLGLTLGAGHYNRGFHQTATAGAFDAQSSLPVEVVSLK